MDIALTFTYQWKRCDVNGENCADILGAINQIYHPTNDDVSNRLRVLITATNDIGQASALSDMSGIISDNKSNETNIAKLFTHRKRVQVGKSIETDISKKLANVYINRANETDEANGVSDINVGIINQANEIDIASSFIKFMNLGKAIEIDTVTQFNNIISISIETDVANEFTKIVLRNINQTSEIDIANSFDINKNVTIGKANENDTVTVFVGQEQESEFTGRIGSYDSRIGKILPGVY